MSDLRHDFVKCMNPIPECMNAEEHCAYEWCGAPRSHSIHSGSQISEGTELKAVQEEVSNANTR